MLTGYLSSNDYLLADLRVVLVAQAQGYEVEEIKKALGEEELISKLKQGGFQAVGIRSKTKITAKVIQACPSVSFNSLEDPCRPVLVSLTDHAIPDLTNSSS